MWRLSATRSTRCLPPPAARLSGLSSTILAVLAPNINKRLEKSDRDESADAQRQHRVFYLSRCAVCIALGSTFAHVTWARDYFNPAFIENHGQASRTSVDLSTFDNDKASCLAPITSLSISIKQKSARETLIFNSRRSVTVNRHYRAVYGSRN